MDAANKPQSKRQLMLSVVGSEEDFEWYPTTDEIIKTVKHDLNVEFRDGFSMLDCGAGDGRVLEAVGASKKYAIEKSKPLLNALPRDVFVVGTEFSEQTLLDKRMDAIFSNPPYREYEQWAEKIISEANAGYIYLVIPERWEKSETIKQAIKARDGKSYVLGSFDFLNADRKARAKVNLVKVTLCYSDRYRSATPKVDPFDLWFESNFSINASQSENATSHFKKVNQDKLKGHISHELVNGGDIVRVLEELYQKDLDELIGTYKKLEEIDGSLLQELNINKKGVCAALKLKIGGLKDLYWHELFDNFGKVTSKLTKQSRERMLKRLTEHTHIDFTSSNAYAVVVWVIKNANFYFDDQLVDVVERMTDKANIQNYKSNKKTWGDDQWRYCSKPNDLDRYKLDYRIVLDRIGGLCAAYYDHEKTAHGLSKAAQFFIEDIQTIGANLGFDCTGYESVADFEWRTHLKAEFRCKDLRSQKEMVLFEAKAFKNGNLHIKFNQDFICRLNVEFGRLKGWIKAPKEAAEELNISFEDAVSCFKSNLTLTDTSCLRIGLAA